MKKPVLKKFPESDIARFVVAHEQFVRRVAGGVKLQLRFADMRGLILQKRDLSEADFAGSDWTWSRLAMSKFIRTSFYCATLVRADLRGVNLSQADLRGASLRGANLYGAMLDEADFRDAELAVANARDGYHLARVEDGETAPAAGSEPPRRGVDLRNCSLKRARLRGARLQGADFSGANLHGAQFKGARLDGAVFHGAILTGVDLKGTRFPEGALASCVMDPSKESLDRTGALLEILAAAERWLASKGREGAVAELSGEDLRTLAEGLVNRRLPGLVAMGVCAVNMDFSGSLLTGANFSGADLRGAKFDGADLRGANFQDCKLAHAQFVGSDLRPLPLGGGREHPVDFTGATVDGVVFTGALRR